MKIDLIKHTINGKVPEEIPSEPITMEQIEELYTIYRNSVPHSGVRYSRYFTARKLDDLSTEELATNIDRKTAQKNLEQAVLFAILRKDIVFPENNGWFWQSANTPQLVLFKTWFNVPDTELVR